MKKILKINDLIISLDKKKDFLNKYLERVNKLGYTQKEIQPLKIQKDTIQMIVMQLTYKSLYDILMKSSNRRLDEIISGEEYLINIIDCPDDYNLVIDLDNLNNNDTKEALIFKDLRQKYCYFQHKSICKEGLKYINGKWQIFK